MRARLARMGRSNQPGNPVLEPLFRAVRANHPKADLALLERAYLTAEKLHGSQMRKSGDPYITHPLAVTTILAGIGMTEPTLVASLLHDTVEDTPYTLDQLRADFGDEVALLVDGVTKLDKVKYGDSAQAETIRKMIVAMSRDIRVLVIKLADRLHNMRTLRYVPQASQERTARETLDIYAPLAHRLGMNTLKWELEDLAFATLHPKIYDEIVRMVAERAPSRDQFLAEVIAQVEADLREAKVKATVTGRPKHYYSIYQKMIVGGREFSDIYDLVGIRILVEEDRDCYSVLGVLHSRWNPVLGRFKDYVAMPKFNMYQSLHTTVIGPQGKPVELQIRTFSMHRRAEYGVAAHWKYKEDGRNGVDTERRADLDDMTWVRQLLDWQSEVEDPGEFLESLRFEINRAEVYVFTPRGDVIALPTGATPVDFAYAVHTEVGHHTIGARVNGRLVPLESTLENGDVVEVFTSKAPTAAPVARLAHLRQVTPGPLQDPSVVHQGAARGGHRAGQGPDRPADAQGGPAPQAAAVARVADARGRPLQAGRRLRALRRRRRGQPQRPGRRTPGHRPARRRRGRPGGPRRGRHHHRAPRPVEGAGRRRRRRHRQGRPRRVGQARQVLHPGARRTRSSASSPRAAGCRCTARTAPTPPACSHSPSGCSRSSGRPPASRRSWSTSRWRRSTGPGCSPTSRWCSPTRT